jgi:hypothetical protein
MLVWLAILLVFVLVLQHRARIRAARERPVARHDALVLPPHLADTLRMPPTFVRPNGQAAVPASAPPPSALPSPPR